MSDYQPTSRRPIASILRRTADLAVRLCVRWGISPDAVSYSSIVAAAIAGVCFWQSGHWLVLVIPAAVFCYVRLWLNMLDGMVALAANKASLRGEMLNDLPDRLSDAMIFAGVAESGYCHPATGYWAAIFALFTAYVGTFGQVLGVGRQFGGIMSKPWRMVVLHLGSWLMAGLLWAGHSPELGSLTVLDWTNLLVILGCTQTIIVRLRKILRGLAERERLANSAPPATPTPTNG